MCHKRSRDAFFMFLGLWREKNVKEGGREISLSSLSVGGFFCLNQKDVSIFQNYTVFLDRRENISLVIEKKKTTGRPLFSFVVVSLDLFLFLFPPPPPLLHRRERRRGERGEGERERGEHIEREAETSVFI